MLRLLLEGIAALLWPPRTTCLLCEGALTDGGEDGPVVGEQVPICAGCWESLSFAPATACCTNCSRPLAGGWGLCIECCEPPAFGQVWALGLHRGALREAIHHLKFGGRKGLGGPLGQRLAHMVDRQYDLIVPMPLHPSRYRERGYNQAALIAEGLAVWLGLPISEGDLIRLRPTGHQAKLDREERLHNLIGAFGVRKAATPPWVGRAVLLVDDVLTTGATAAAAAEALWTTGACAVDLAVLAVSDKPIPVARGAGW